MGLRLLPAAPPAPPSPNVYLPALALTFALAIGCAGAGKGITPTGTGGTSTPGSAGTTGSAGVSGNAGNTGSAGTTGSAGIGGTGSGGPGTAGTGVTGSAGTGAAGTGSAGTAGVTGTAGTGSSGTAGVTGSAGAGSNMDGGTDAVCQQAQYKFEPKVPTVFVLVDRSGSEFDKSSCMSDHYTKGIYYTLRTAALQVIQQLQGEVRFGFGAFVGGHQAPYACPTFNSVPTALNNYTAISTLYNSIDSLPCSATSDTPAVQVIPMARAALQADTGTGQKYMLFVTDSETDFCDNGSPLCPADAVTSQLQEMYRANIGTLIIGLPTEVGGGVAFNTAVLQNFANAGAGQPVAVPGGGATTPAQVHDGCVGAGGGAWMRLYTAAGRTGTQPLSTYSTTGGTARVYAPGSAAQQALTDQILAALAGVKSCVFDLGDVGGKSIKVDMTKLDQAHIKIEGTEVPLSDTNGWKLNNPTQLELVGAACTTWRTPAADDIDFQFPCSTIIFE